MANKPLSAQERAEKIALNIHKLQHPGTIHVEWNETGKEIIAMIAAEIQAAVDEAMVKAFEGEDCKVARLEQAAYKHGVEDGSKAQFAGDKEHYEDRIKQAVDLEREECAKIADKYASDPYNSDTRVEAENLAAEIRSRGGEEKR